MGTNSRPLPCEHRTDAGGTSAFYELVTDEAVASVVQDVLRGADNFKTFVRLCEYECTAVSRRNRLLIRLNDIIWKTRRLRQGSRSDRDRPELAAARAEPEISLTDPASGLPISDQSVMRWRIA